ncbi:hypothetical protein DFR76_10467 [Nocardia pseudobrasiliensis]|uniref:Uncharacterized protein n=1 Tax=Nocardia pseudobrasiliensis TaxID=45979 RepID=A0A370I873_9NOCA|nr:hypothetical protein DFR76_10467 [Nocardia pseudobrasiliensis]
MEQRVPPVDGDGYEGQELDRAGPRPPGCPIAAIALGAGPEDAGLLEAARFAEADAAGLAALFIAVLEGGLVLCRTEGSNERWAASRPDSNTPCATEAIPAAVVVLCAGYSTAGMPLRVFV